MKNIIYALVDPRDNTIRYIGKSTKGVARLRDHLKPRNLIKHNHKNNWINLLLVLGFKPNIMIIESFDNKFILNEKEIFYIKHYKELGHDLTNSTEGGEGTPGYKHKEDTIEVLSQKRKDYFENRIEPWVPVNKKNYEIINNIEHKHCSDCDTYKPLTEYHNTDHTWDKLRTICKVCSNKRSADHKIKNPPKLLNDTEWNDSYGRRNKNVSKGVQKAYDENPDLKRQQSIRKSQAVIRTDPGTGQQTEYPSALATVPDGFDNRQISTAIKSGKLHRGYYWRKK